MASTMNMLQLGLGTLVALAVGLGARRAGALTPDGAWAAVIVGGLTMGIGGWAHGVALLTFFISSSLLSRVGRERKLPLVSHFAKGSARDASQVLANGGLASALVVLFGSTREGFWLVGALGALAAANADTWATELGVLARRRPRLITSGAVVEAGTSGAISPEGFLASLGGGSLIGLSGILLGAGWSGGIAAALGGIFGSLADSFLGASWQAIYYCPTCVKQTERHPHHYCGTETQQIRGWRRLGNDEVNFAATLVGAAVAAALWNGIILL